GVHPVEVGPALDGGPGLDQQLVGDPSAQEIVAGHQVLVRILLSVLGEVRVAPAALLSLAETAGILDHAIEGDQGRHAELPHSGLLSCAGQVLPATSSAASAMAASICTTTALVPAPARSGAGPVRHAVSPHRAEVIAVQRAPARKEDRKKTGSFTLAHRPDREPAHCANPPGRPHDGPRWPACAGWPISRAAAGWRGQAPAGHDCTHPDVRGCRLDP